MAAFEVYSHPELRRYRTSLCSKAAFLQLIILALTWIPPLLIAYRSEGFWKKIESFSEQPDVNFKYEMLLILDTSLDGDYVTWSTYQNYNQLQMEKLRVPVVKAKESDVNGDGRNDELDLSIQMPLLDAEKVYGVKLILIYDYLLTRFPYFQMESMTFIQHESARSGAELEVKGDLTLHQGQPLNHKGVDTTYNDSVIDRESVYSNSFQLSSILANYTSRNVTTVLSNTYALWKTGRSAQDPFRVNALVRYKEEKIILYSPGFWQLIKGGWIQYVAILVVFWFVFTKIKIFIFQNQIVTTVVERPFKQKSQ